MKSEFILLIHMMVILTLAAANPAAIEKDATTGVAEMILIPAEFTGVDNYPVLLTSELRRRYHNPRYRYAQNYRRPVAYYNRNPQRGYNANSYAYNQPSPSYYPQQYYYNYGPFADYDTSGDGTHGGGGDGGGGGGGGE